MSHIQLLSIQVGLPQAVGRADLTGSGPASWTTAFHKQPVKGRVWVGTTNVEGDRQAASKTHGGPDRAVCIYPWEHYSYWQRELNLPELVYGAFAENLTVQGEIEDQACIGDTIRFGDVHLQITQPRPPCWRLARWWQIKEFTVRMEETGKTGWHCRVIKEGYAEAGSTVELLDRPHPEWTVSMAHHLVYRAGSDPDQMAALASCRLLSESWRDTLLARRAKLTRSAGESIGHP